MYLRNRRRQTKTGEDELMFKWIPRQILRDCEYSPCCQLECLDFAQLVAGQCGNYLLQRLEGIVQTLRTLAFPHIGHDPLVAKLVRLLRFARLAFQATPRLAERLASCIDGIVQQAAVVAEAGRGHAVQLILLGIAADGAERCLARVFHIISIGTGVSAAIEAVRRLV